MDENHYWIEQLCYDGTWARLSDLYDEEMTARAAWYSANWLCPPKNSASLKRPARY